MKFTKMQGAGNDYVYIDCTKKTPENLEKLAQAVSLSHYGIGADGLVVICQSIIADFKMRMFNRDGSEAQMCGNAIRCVGKFIHDKGLSAKEYLTIETLAGTKSLELTLGKDNSVEFVKVDMGRASTNPQNIPVLSPENPFKLNVSGTEISLFCVSMGNPHAVVFVENLNIANFEEVGREIECNQIFPEKTNVEFVKVLSRTNIQMRVWERGSGETLACGTGACAAFVACHKNGFCDDGVTVSLTGGNLFIELIDGKIFLTGEAKTVFEGELSPEFLKEFKLEV